MVQMIKKFSVFIMILVVVLCGCQNGGKEDPAPVDPTQKEETESATTEPTSDKKEDPNGFLQLSMQNPLTLHPIYNVDPSVQQNLNLVFDTLVDLQSDGSITPNLAESWSFDETDHSVTLRLRDDVMWQDGSRLTAEDVVFSLTTIQNATNTPYKLTTKNMAHAQALDAQTVKISYRTAFSGVYQTLYFPVIPKHIYDVPKEEALGKVPVGSGPYTFVTRIPNKEVTLTANADYFQGTPKIETIKIMITPDERSELDAFEQNLIDAIYTDVMDWGKYTKDKSAEVYELTTQYYEFMGLNFNKPLFQNETVREVLTVGLNRQSVLDTYYLGHGIVTDTPVSPNSFLYDQTLGIKAYDKEKAKLLLVQEGYVFDNKTKYFMKNNLPLSFNLLVNQENKDRLSVAEGITRMYKEIGIQVVIESVDATTYKNRIYNKQFDAFLGGWKLSYIPDLSFAFHSSQMISGDNFISYNDPGMDDLLSRAFNTSPTYIKTVYSELQQYMAEKNPYISLYFRNGALITKKKVKGPIEPTPLNVFANIEAWYIEN